ncbi:hypothetical protein MKX01_038342 [Papaver californicum]|nr:hypothetical protein MKX01_038342 [Papaver californicum]
MEIDLICLMFNNLNLNFVSQNPFDGSSFEIDLLYNLFAGISITGDDLNSRLNKYHNSSFLCVSDLQESDNSFPATGINDSGDLCQVIGGSGQNHGKSQVNGLVKLIAKDANNALCFSEIDSSPAIGVNSSGDLDLSQVNINHILVKASSNILHLVPKKIFKPKGCC